MADVTLKITADTSGAVTGIKNTQAATQKLNDAAKSLNKQMDVLFETQKKGFSTTKDVIAYTKAMENLKKQLTDVEKEQQALNEEQNKTSEKAVSSGNKMMAAAKSWALGFATVTVAVKILKETLLSFLLKSQEGIELFERKISGLRASVSILQGEFIKLGKAMIGERGDEAAPWGTRIVKGLKLIATTANLIPGVSKYFDDLAKKMNEASAAAEKYTLMSQEIEDAERALIVPRAEANFKIKEARLLYADDTKGIEIRTKALESALAMENEVADKEIKHQQWKILQIRAVNIEKEKAGQLTDEDRKKLQLAIAEEINLQTESVSRQFRAANSLNALRNEALRKHEEFVKLSIQLIEKYDQSNIESLTGVDKLKAQRDFGIKQIKEIRDQMARLGTISDEQFKMLDILAGNVWEVYYKALANPKNNKLPDSEKKKISDALLEGFPALKGLQDSTLTELQERQIALANKGIQPFSIWSLMGINPESDEGRKQMDALLEAKTTILTTMDEIFEARVNDAQRQRELIETQINETQNDLNIELELYKAGYASNVAAKKKELEELKKQREIALRKEEEAIKRQRQLDTITQISSLITASAKIFEAFGAAVPAAIAMVAIMFSAFAATKIRAAEMTKLAEGGSGTKTGLISGKSHNRGGEQFLRHVEVEGGESWGVLSVPATQKFGKVFHHMVSSFNKGQIPAMPINKISSNVMVENSGPNSRLDKLITEQRKLNEKISGDSVQDIGNTRIIRKGATTRIINK